MEKSMELKLEDLPEILTVEQLSVYLSVTKATIYNWCNSGDMPSLKVGNTRRIRKSTFLIWIDKQENAG